MRKIYIFIILSYLSAQPQLDRFKENSIRVYFNDIPIKHTNKIISEITSFPFIDSLYSNFGEFKISKWLSEANDFDKIGNISLSNYYDIIFMNDEVDIKKVINILKNEKTISDFEYIPKRKLHFIPNDPYFDNQWHHEKIQSVEAWNLWDIENGETPGDSTIVVAIVDTGCEWDHPDLIDNLWQNLDEDADNDGRTIEFINEKWVLDPGDINNIDEDNDGYIDNLIGWDYGGVTDKADPDNNPMSPPTEGPTGGHQHGTHIAGIISSSVNNNIGGSGVGYSVKYMPIKIQYDESSSDTTFDHNEFSDILSTGVLHAAKAGADVINLSLGGLGSSSSERALYDNIYNNYNAIVVAAAGNSGVEELQYPASYETVISVGASDPDDEKSSFSSYGSGVNILAPGSSIFSTLFNESYGRWSGTSMASPVVSASVALIWSYFPDFSKDKIKQLLLKGADDVSDKNSNFNDKIGSGRVNIYNSIGSGLLPKLTASSFSITSINDDDGILNPGEKGSLRLVVENSDGWANASQVKVTASSMNPNIIFIKETANFPNIPSGGSGVNVQDKIEFETSQSMIPQEVKFKIVLEAKGNSNEDFIDSSYIYLDINYNQLGFPFYAESLIRTSPTILDLQNNSEKQIIFGSDDRKLYSLNILGEKNWSFEAQRDIRSTPAFGDIDKDNNLEIIFGSMDSTLYILNKNGSLIRKYKTNGKIISSPVLFDYDYNGKLEIAFNVFDEYLYLIDHLGNNISPFPINIGEPIFSSPAVADIDNDGLFEIIISTRDGAIYSFDTNGNLEENFPFLIDSRISTSPILFDLNNNGNKEIIFGADNKNLYIVNSNGVEVASFLVEDKIHSSPIIYDINLDGLNEIIFGTNNGELYCLNFKSDSLYVSDGWPVNFGNVSIKSSPVVHDLDGNTFPEIIFGLSNGKIYALNFNGLIYPGFPSFVSGPVESSFSIDDIDGDGDLEIASVGSSELILIDVKDKGGKGDFWSMDRGGPYRQGVISEFKLNLSDDKILPKEFNISRNYPNPFNSKTAFDINLVEDTFVKIRIYNIIGEEINVLHAGNMNRGSHNFIWNGKNQYYQNVPSGLYFLHITSDNFNFTTKMTLLK